MGSRTARSPSTSASTLKSRTTGRQAVVRRSSGPTGYCSTVSKRSDRGPDVVPAGLPSLRGPRGHRLRFRRRDRQTTERLARRARAQHLQLLPPQRGRGPEGVVVPPFRLSRLVHRRARHHHQPGAEDGGGRVSRLAAQPGERIDRSRPLSFTYDGKKVSGYEGDTIASALYAGGRRIFSRSFKYHRPRGEICACGQCANSLVDVDGSPGVRACGEPARAGITVSHLNAWPSLEHDVMSATDRFGGRFTQVGFYYKTFIRPRRLWPVYEKVLRSAAGLGRLRKRQVEREWETEYRRRHCDVLVVGGGIAGLAAALRAAELGADVVLCDEDVEPGGAQLFEGGHERARALAEQARAAGVELLGRGTAIGFFD